MSCSNASMNESNNTTHFPYCDEKDFLPKKGVIRRWWVTWNKTVALFQCHKNHEQVGGNTTRTCDFSTGNWTGEEIVCKPEYFKSNTILFLVILLSTFFVSTAILVVDFILRRYRKGKLRTEKLRIARITRIRNINHIDSTRIRNFPTNPEDIVGMAIREISQEAEDNDGQLDDDLRYQRRAMAEYYRRRHTADTNKDGEREGPMNVFQAFRPKIRIGGPQAET